MVMENRKWISCPICGNKTRLKIRQDTTRYDFKELSTLLSKMQIGRFDRSGRIKCKSHQRARRIDAEPMNL